MRKVRIRIHLQAAACKHAHEDKLDPPRNLQRAQERHRRDEQQDVINNINPRKPIMKHRAIDATPRYAVVPVLGHGPAGDGGGGEAEGAVDGEVDDEGEEVTLGTPFREDSLALEEDGEFDGEVGYRVGEDGGVEGLEEVGEDGIVNRVAEAVADL